MWDKVWQYKIVCMLGVLGFFEINSEIIFQIIVWQKMKKKYKYEFILMIFVKNYK